MIWSATEIPLLLSDLFFCLNLPSALFTRIEPYSRSTHVGVVCGQPTFIKVATKAKFLSSEESKDNEDIIRLAEKDKQIEELVKKQNQFEVLIQSLIDSGQLKSILK